MLETITIGQYLKHHLSLPLVDVRSPAEYKKGHIPNAVNVPIFSDEERAVVGTAYKQESKERAIEIGMEYVQPKLRHFIDETLRVASKQTVVVHCWRGGMRSRSFAQHLVENGFAQVYVIESGYKAFRKHVLHAFEEDAQLIILGGYTGSAKTDILKQIDRDLGHQVIDLERLANHRGSAFGGIGQAPQPTVEQFENNVFWEWKDLDFTREIWVEDESRAIGTAMIPEALFKKMRSQRMYFLDIPRDERARHLVKGYGKSHTEKLQESIMRISSRLGGLNTDLALKHLARGEMFEVARIALIYYDKYYARGVAKRDPEMVTSIPLKTTESDQNVRQIIQAIIERT
ncbi:tRNA 2-selenouridine(34) synthase MnmH [Verrucomicrobia bacterium]|nr:tRNA 2-selenouridine(34) synthase MnmH [Verrucomicrobiota bacterium]